jgi:hypothetical protein
MLFFRFFLSFLFFCFSFFYPCREIPGDVALPGEYDITRSGFYNPSNYRELYDFLVFKGVRWPLLYTCVAMVECGDSLASADYVVRKNPFGITSICADHYSYKYERADCRSDACYVRFCDYDEAVKFMLSWESAVPNVWRSDEFLWLCHVRRYNPGNPYYIDLLLSKKRIVERYIRSKK